MKTKKQLTNRILSLVLALVMMVGLLPTISFTASAAAAELFQGFDTYGITITSVYFAFPNASNGSVWTIYHGDHVFNGATLELYIEGEPVNGKVTACFIFSWKDYLNGEKIPGKLELDCSCDKTYAYGTTSPKITFDDGSILYINMVKNAQSHNMTKTSNGDNTHTSTCSLCKETSKENCSGASGVNCTNSGTCTACKGQYKNPSVHTWTYSASGNVVTASCPCGKAGSYKATLQPNTTSYTYTGDPFTNAASITYPTGWPGEKPQPAASDYSNNTNVGTATVTTTVEGKELTTTFKIDPADIADATVALSPTSGDYNGTEQKPDISVIYEGLLLTENTDYTFLWDKTGFINADTYTVTVTGKGNFEGTKRWKFTINAANLTDVKVEQVGTLTYTGEALTPAVSTNAVAVNNQPITFTYSTESEGPYSTEIPSFTNAGWAHTVYYIATADNHNTYYGSFLVEIEKATVTEPTIASKPYNGAVQTADITDTELYTVVKNEGGTGVKQNGYYDVILELKDAANYKWSSTDGARVTLKFKITRGTNEWASPPSISGWTYGETAKTPVGAAKYGTVKVIYSGTANDSSVYSSETAPTKAGNYTATFTVAGTEDYSSLSEQVNFTIAKKTVTVTAKDAGKTYGDSDPALTYTNTALVGQDTLDITVFRASGENANTYTITASQEEGANPNYEITFKKGTFTIHKAPLTVTAEDKTATYGDAVPTYTVKYDGFKNGDDKDDLGGNLDFHHDYRQFGDVGEYEIKPHGLTSGNYEFFYNFGKLTVSPKAITVTVQNTTGIYGEALIELKATDNGIVNGDKDVYSLSTTATSTSNVGKYAITGTALDSNYAITFVNGEYEITKREITIIAEAKNMVVNTELPTYTYKVEDLFGADELVTEPTFICNADITVIGEYDITASGADAGGNYSIKYVPAKLTVLTDNAVDAAASYNEELKDYDPATATSEDKAELDEILDEINTILDDENITDNGKKALEKVKEQVENLIEEINEAAKAALAELNKPADPNSPQTGDNSNMFLWIALFFISGGALITLTVVDRKRKSAAKR